MEGGRHDMYGMFCVRHVNLSACLGVHVLAGAQLPQD